MPQKKEKDPKSKLLNMPQIRKRLKSRSPQNSSLQMKIKKIQLLAEIINKI